MRISDWSSDVCSSDLPQDLRWGRSYEGYAADPQLVADYAKAMVLGLQGTLVAGKSVDAQHVAATAKPFVADGGTFEGKAPGDAKIDETGLIEKHAMGYPAAIDAGALTVMASFPSWQRSEEHTSELPSLMRSQYAVIGLTKK